MGATQLAWSIGPTITFILAVLLVPLGLFGSGLPWHRTRKGKHCGKLKKNGMEFWKRKKKLRIFREVASRLA
ncbi:MAG: hypothetical protein C6W54_00620 [Bacillaceae bacterium]|nr:MAG: hypothetical protein C6W54_00620 [Bacillaceae bacterium]